MLLHYLGKVNSYNLLQITTEKLKKRVVFDKNETFMLSYGWLEIGVIVFYSICSKCSPARMHEDACATRQLHCQWCSGRCHATLAANAVSVRQCRAPATGTQLDDAPDPIINRIMVRAVCWPKIRWNAGVSREVAQCHVPVCWVVVLLKNEKFPIPRTSRLVSAIDLNAWVDEDEVCTAQLRCADRHHKGLTERGSSAQETFTSDLFLSSSVCYLQRIFNKNQKLKQIISM